MSDHNGKPIINCQSQLNSLWCRFNQSDPNANGPQEAPVSVESSLNDQQVLDRARNARNGDKFRDLENGNTPKYYRKSDGSPDQSKADFALVNMLAFYTQDREQIVRLFRQSALGARDKAKRDDYVNRMVDKALRDHDSVPLIPIRLDGLRTPTVNASGVADDDRWPVMADAAYHGIAGNFVRAIEPHSEADPVALLMQFLTAVGCLFGRGAYMQVGATRHHPNLFSVIVGNTAKARKGTSWDWIREFLKFVDGKWYGNKCRSGLVSGEGLVYYVRDPKVEEAKVSGQVVDVHPRLKTIDKGVTDKRFLAVEHEFGSVLSCAKRDGNTLSDHIRKAWDGNEKLETLAKNSETVATGAHVAIVGHITKHELNHRLSQNDRFNGFGNRFLWALTKRSKLLPTGGGCGCSSVARTVR